MVVVQIFEVLTAVEIQIVIFIVDLDLNMIVGMYPCLSTKWGGLVLESCTSWVHFPFILCRINI